jgi:adenosylhomocysteine nucleosidase
MSRIAIIAALERELDPLVRGWARSRLQASGKSLPCFESGEVIAVAGGVGCHRAELAARAVIEKYRPQVLVSAGLAGALIRSLKVGNIVTPNVIVDAATGTEYRCQLGGDVVGGGVLVSAAEITGSGSKASLARRFHALVVDMEAAGVAKVAQEFNVGFRCVKAISDEFDFAMPPMDKFVDGEGDFRTGTFLRWAALRPQYWPATIRLARKAGQAARALADWLKRNLAGNFPPATVVTLDRSEHFRD